MSYTLLWWQKGWDIQLRCTLTSLASVIMALVLFTSCLDIIHLWFGLLVILVIIWGNPSDLASHWPSLTVTLPGSMSHIPSSLQAQQSQVHLVSTHPDHQLLTHSHYVGSPRGKKIFYCGKKCMTEFAILTFSRVQIISINLIHSIIGLPCSSNS